MSLSCLYDSIQSSTTDCQEKKNTYQRLLESILLKANELFFSEYNFITEHLFCISMCTNSEIYTPSLRVETEQILLENRTICIVFWYYSCINTGSN